MTTTRAVDERLVAQIWERQAFDAEALSPLSLHVLFRGVPSDAGGPDYQDALLVYRERDVLHGDVEFHVRSSDWYGHGHHLDRRYSTVILHVVWVRNDVETLTSDGRTVPILELNGYGSTEGVSMFETTEPILAPHPCVERFGRLSPGTLHRRILEAGMTRFEARTQRFAAEAAAQTADQVAYTALLEGLGYASNRDAFRHLADVVPLSWLYSIPAEQRVATLLEAAGLGPPADFPPPSHLDSRMWRLVRLRPANHPATRLRGIVHLLNRMAPALADGLVQCVQQATGPRDLRSHLLVRDADGPLIGSGRADELAVSVVLPLISGLFPHMEEPGALFVRFPAPPANRWTRFMVDLIQQAGHQYSVTTAPQHQGLHHVYHQFCRPERPRSCPVCKGV